MRKTISRLTYWAVGSALCYIAGVWFCAYSIETTSMSSNIEADRLGCPRPYVYRVLDRERKPNPWLWQSKDEIVFRASVLQPPACFGAYLMDISKYKYGCHVIVFDVEKDAVIFVIEKPSY